VGEDAQTASGPEEDEEEEDEGMRWICGVLAFSAGCAGAAAVPSSPPPAAPLDDAAAEALRSAVAEDLAYLVEAYRWFHRNPELSNQEERTAARFAEELRKAGWEVTAGVGGHGVVGVLSNGPGPTILARIDMDGLPIQERTGLPYASTSGVMHACGHDAHLAIGVGLARLLGRLRDRWTGTAVLVGQPAEEVGQGARRMTRDPRFAAALSSAPEACLSVHDDAAPAGTVGVCAGYASANVDSIDIVIHGRGGHGAWPHRTVDPVVIGSEIVTALQTIVSRKLAPGTKAVVTVGSFHAGTKHNIIPDEARLQLTVRSYEDGVRATLLAEIRRLATKIAEAHGAPKAAEIREAEEFTPAGYHDPALTARMKAVFARQLGAERVREVEPMMGGEDFSVFPRHFKVPGLQFRVGGAAPGHDPEVGLHSARWAVDPEPTLKTGVEALVAGMLDLLGRR
jgi:amidohydrolase